MQEVFERIIEQLEELKQREINRPDDCDENGIGDGEQIYEDGRSQGRYEQTVEIIKIIQQAAVKYAGDSMLKAMEEHKEELESLLAELRKFLGREWITIIKEKPVEKGEYSVSYPDGTVSIQYWDGHFFSEINTVSGKSIIGQPVAWKQKYEPHRPCTDEEPKIQTNADRIKSMPIEELAELFYSLINLEDEIKFCKNKTECEDILDAGKTIPDKMCKKCLVDWMQSEEEEPDER